MATTGSVTSPKQTGAPQSLTSSAPVTSQGKEREAKNGANQGIKKHWEKKEKDEEGSVKSSKATKSSRRPKTPNCKSSVEEVVETNNNNTSSPLVSEASGATASKTASSDTAQGKHQEQKEAKERYMRAINQQRHRLLSRIVCDDSYTVEDLCKAAWDGGDIEKFKKILKFLSVDEINKTNSRGQTALVCLVISSVVNSSQYCAARKGFVDYVEALLNVPGIDVNRGEVAKKSTPLHGTSFIVLLRLLDANLEPRPL